MKIRWLNQGTRSLELVHARIAFENPPVAKKVAHRIRIATNRLGRFPHSGRLGEISGTREGVVSGMPFIVVYQVPGDEVHLLRVFPDAQQRAGIQ